MMARAFCFGFDPGDWFAGSRAGAGPRGRRGRRVRFGSGDMKYVILSLLAEKPMHGYEVMKALEEQTHGCYKPSPGTVYPTLQWLEDEGLVVARDEEGKKIYEITEQGRTFLEEHKSTVDDIFDRVEETIESIFADPIPEVTRFVGRVAQQAYRAAWKVRNDAEKRARMREILERTMQELDELVV